MTKATIAALGFVLMSTNSFAQARRDALDPVLNFPEIAKLIEGVSPVIKEAARNHALSSAQTGTENRATVSSTDRPRNSPIHSPAHDRGAIDVVNIKTGDARAISRDAGNGYTVIHEIPKRRAPGTQGPEADLHAIYRGGTHLITRTKPQRATAEHIHIQPEFNSRLYKAAQRLEAAKQRLSAPRTNNAAPTSRPAPAPTMSAPRPAPPRRGETLNVEKVCNGPGPCANQ